MRRAADPSCAVRSTVMECSAGTALVAAMAGCVASRSDRHDESRSGSARPDAAVRDAEVRDGAVRLTRDLTRIVILATGMLDEVPNIAGFAEV